MRKLALWLLIILIRPIQYFDVRLFVRLYVVLLRARGVVFEGMPRFISPRSRFDNPRLISIGDRVVVSDGVVFLTHDYSYTTAIISLGKTPPTDIAILRKIKIGSNVFVGMNAMVLPGTVIGDNCIVGAGCVVKGNIPSGSVLIGSPARLYCKTEVLAEKWLQCTSSSDLLVDKK